MLLSLRKNALTSLFKEVRVLKVPKLPKNTSQNLQTKVSTRLGRSKNKSERKGAERHFLSVATPAEPRGDIFFSVQIVGGETFKIVEKCR